MIMIIGSEDEYHARFIYDKLQAKGAECFYLDSREFPSNLSINLTPNRKTSPGFLRLPDGRVVDLASIQSVYWRYYHGLSVSSELPEEAHQIVYREIESAMGSLFRNLPHALWVNPASAIDRHRYKPHQLQLMADMGLSVPDTLITNDPETVHPFFEAHGGRVIYKPVAGGAHTAMLTLDDLTPERLKDLRTSPVQFQECIDGVDVRVYVVGKAVFTAEIRAETLDFRDNPEAPIVPVTLPDDIAEQCLKIAELFEYRFTGIDIRRTPEGRHVFIEANPSPMFVHFEKVTGYPISDTLVSLLMRRFPEQV